MLRPIDMQTLLMQMDKVGKDFAHTRDNVINQQNLEAQKLLKLEEQQAHAVTQTNEIEGSKVSPDGQGTQNSFSESGPRKKKEEVAPVEEKKKDEPWKDPLLGTHVDISR